MKKLVALLLAACMTLVLFAGCNSTEEEGSETQESQQHINEQH